MRTKKQGAALDLYIMSKCAELLMEVPPESRKTIVEWLAARVVSQLPNGKKPEPQPTLFGES